MLEETKEFEGAHKTQTFSNGHMMFDENNKFDKAKMESLVAHMNTEDLISYEFLEGFIERSTELTDFTDVQKNDTRLDLLDH